MPDDLTPVERALRDVLPYDLDETTTPVEVAVRVAVGGKRYIWGDWRRLAASVETAVRAAGWVPLAEVLDALRDEAALLAWYMARHPYACIDIGSAGFFAEYLAERVPHHRQ